MSDTVLAMGALAQVGGVFAVLSFVHFFVDWIFQSHAEAMQKHKNAVIRAKHCLIYATGFVPVFVWLKLSWAHGALLFAVLFLSHFVEDTYLPVFLWAKYVRKPDEMKSDDLAGFVAFSSTPLGKILLIAVDQIIHLAFVLLVAVCIVMWRGK